MARSAECGGWVAKGAAPAPCTSVVGGRGVVREGHGCVQPRATYALFEARAWGATLDSDVRPSRDGPAGESGMGWQPQTTLRFEDRRDAATRAADLALHKVPDAEGTVTLAGRTQRSTVGELPFPHHDPSQDHAPRLGGPFRSARAVLLCDRQARAGSVVQRRLPAHSELVPASPLEPVELNRVHRDIEHRIARVLRSFGLPLKTRRDPTTRTRASRSSPSSRPLQSNPTSPWASTAVNRFRDQSTRPEWRSPLGCATGSAPARLRGRWVLHACRNENRGCEP